MPMEPLEVQEIHDEQSEAIERFEKLVAELVDDYRHSGLSLHQYLVDPYQDRMQDELVQEGRSLSPENVAGIE